MEREFGSDRNEALLERAMECWNGLQGFRRQRERCKKFTYGDQWDDIIDDGCMRMREEDYIRSQGNMPLKNNLIRRLVRNVLGVFRNKWEPPRFETDNPPYKFDIVKINSFLRQNMYLNRLEEIYARSMEEFLISGMAVHKKWYGRRGHVIDCWTDVISPDRFFFDLTSRDFRGLDLGIVGEIHEMTADDIIAAFAANTEELERICRIFGLRDFTDSKPSSNLNQILPYSKEKYKVFEVWEKRRCLRLRCHDLNSARIFDTHPGSSLAQDGKFRSRLVFNEEWHYSFLTSDGTVIASGSSPYPGGNHPYVFKAYPFIDGEIHSFVADIIDQQKLTNRLVSMYDWILRASAKGVLLFPEGALPDGVDINDVAEEWSRFNGVIIYRPKAGVPLPQQISSNSTDIGITGLLEIQMKMMEDISGVNGALQGRLDNGSMSGTLYDQQTRNSLTALADLLRSYDDFIDKATERDVENIMKFYPGERTGDMDIVRKHRTPPLIK